MPPHFSHPPAYLTATHPTPYLYPQPSVPAHPTFGPPTPFPFPPMQLHLLPPPGQVFAQQGAPNFLPSQKRGKAINLPLVIMDPILQVFFLTLLPSHRVLSPSRTGHFAPIIPVRVAVFMVTTLMIVPYYHKCGRCGSLRPSCKDNTPPLLSLPIQLLLNPLCLPTLSLNKDLWLLNHHMPR